MTKVTVVVIAAVFVAALVLTIVAVGTGAPARWRLEHGAKVGWTRSEVVDRLGSPNYTARTRAELLEKDRWHQIPRTQVSGQVMVYLAYPWRLYVYLDKSDRVREVHIL